MTQPVVHDADSIQPSSTRMLLRTAGILAVIGGGLFFAFWVYFGFEFRFFEVYVVLNLIAGVVAVAGGVLALRRQVQIAPWLIAAALLLATLGAYVNWRSYLVFIPDAPFPFYWPWTSLSVIANIGDFAEPVFAFLDVAANLGVWLLVAAFILGLIAFIRAPKSPMRSDSPPVTSVGLAVPDADGSIPEGWYADPDGKPSERYWDGEAWTEKSRPQTAVTATVAGASKPTVTANGEPISPKSRAAAAVLCWFLGVIGIHRFYVGKVGTGVAQILTLGGLGVWVLIDFIVILVGSFKDKEERVLANW